jgi:hypothetical protein
MKVCPQCQNTYTDDSLQFCLQDGSPLVNQTVTTDWTESETVISPPKRREQNQVTQNLPNNFDWQPSQEIGNLAIEPPKTKSNKFQIFVLAGLALSVFLGLVGFGTWVLVRNMQNEIANKTTNKTLDNATLPNKKPSVNISNVNIVSTATPTPKPTLNPAAEAIAKSDVADVIKGWKGASENLDLDAHMGYYADTIDYYKAGNVGAGKVRGDKQKAYSMYDTISVDISNLKTTIDPSGEKATAVFDKEWLFENSEKTNSGKVQQQLQLTKFGGKWRITGEKDLKVYYVNK